MGFEVELRGGEEGIWRELVELLDDEGSEENEEKSFESLQRR